MCSEKKVRAMSGSPAHFWPVWFQRRAIRVVRIMRMETSASKLEEYLRDLERCKFQGTPEEEK